MVIAAALQGEVATRLDRAAPQWNHVIIHQERFMSPARQQPRVPPRQRFAGNEHVINLDYAFAELPGESTAYQGHMQKTLYRLGPTTTAIFQFEKGGTMDKHAVEGEAIIHVLGGRLSVQTPAGKHELRGGDMLLLNPGVPHDVKAIEPTRMLLTVVLGE
jgi:quercetin dioxygenase-like cupin family protein